MIYWVYEQITYYFYSENQYLLYDGRNPSGRGSLCVPGDKLWLKLGAGADKRFPCYH